MKNLITLLTILITLNGYSQLPTDTIGFDGINTRLLDSLTIVYLNEERVSRGLDPLIVNDFLNDHALKHTQWMVDNKKFEHSATGMVNGECCSIGGIWGAETYEFAARASINGWFSSPPHKKILLSSSFKSGGCATVIEDYNYGIYGVKSTFNLSIDK